MAEPALTLRDHPQIIDLISVLEQSGLQKQKEEVQALVGYIDGTTSSGPNRKKILTSLLPSARNWRSMTRA